MRWERDCSSLCFLGKGRGVSLSEWVGRVMVGGKRFEEV